MESEYTDLSDFWQLSKLCSIFKQYYTLVAYTENINDLHWLVNRNQHTIRELNLDLLEDIGLKSWNGYLNALQDKP